jgi:hypothetical protein
MQTNAEVGEEIRNNHLKENTKKQYQSKFNTFLSLVISTTGESSSYHQRGVPGD